MNNNMKKDMSDWMKEYSAKQEKEKQLIIILYLQNQNSGEKQINKLVICN